MRRLACLALLALSLPACEFQRSASARRSDGVLLEGPPARNLATAVRNYDAGIDYFPEKAGVRHATQFRVTYHRSYKVIDLQLRTREQLRYVLYQRGTPPPAVDPDARLVPVPVERYALSTFRYAGAAAKLGVVDRMVALSNWRNSTTPEVRARIDSGALPGNYSIELVAGREAELLFNYHSSATLTREFDSLAALGVTFVPMAEALEPTPLGKAEWIKFFAAFFNREAEAETLFAAAEARYLALASAMRGVSARPRVFVHTASRDEWYLFSADNAFARLVADAGGDYVWHDVGGSLNLTSQPLERALQRGLEADVWLVGADLIAFAERPDFLSGQPFPFLRPLRNNRLFVAHPTGEGPNPYWDHALYQPDVELADYIRMLHPDRLPDHHLRFYRHLPVSASMRRDRAYD